MRPSHTKSPRAVAGDPKREAGNLVVGQEKLAALGGESLFDQALGEVRHVGAMRQGRQRDERAERVQ